ncbi:MAG TPA: demethoxyubiquinone hydroxylase family protein [Caulobacterales bacterium]|nr:demethoxyubiquinone hydroxylase family protein [Caulobacterales bacterium]
MAETTDRAAPASPGERARRIEAMIRVDHAGEFGAVQIYRGQRAVFERIAGKAEAAALIAEMEAGEKSHLETFDRLVRERGVRPTALAPLWRLAGFGLGAATALMGEKAAHACTAAVEEVIEEHYGAQALELGDGDPELKSTVEQFRADEIGHKDTAVEHGAHDAPAYPLLSAAIKLGCRVAIRASEIV